MLIVDDEADICRVLRMCLEADGHDVVAANAAAPALAEVGRRSFDLVFLDLRLGTDDGLNLIGPLLDSSPWTKVVVITAFAAVETAVEAMKRGASDYLSKPFTPAQVKLAVRKVAESLALARRAAALQESLAAVGPQVDLLDTASAEMREAVEVARRAADGSAAVLVRGESGTGKRTLARAIHGWSPRADRPFAVAGCRAPTAALLEAEWFGSAKRMPNKTVAEQPGRVAYCDGGTLLVEDVEQLPATTQSKLLRLVQDQEFERVADFAPRRADVRVVATTAADLDAEVAAGRFRADLLFALRGVAVDLPPLRRRVDDIVPLAERYLAFFSRQARRPAVGFAPAAADALRRHSWPGNVRELRNLVERAVLVCREATVDTHDFPPGVLNRVGAVAIGDPVTLAVVEELHIRGVLAAAPTIEAAATTLGIDTVTLWRRRKQYEL
ncbi:MAG TPA: sigma-54 dependent transcriptional regulator [Humisphaera sp.]